MVSIGRGKEMGSSTYDCDDAVGFQGTVEIAQEFIGEEGDGLGAAGEDIVDDVVVALGGVVGDLGGVVNGIVDDSVVVGCEIKVLDCILQDDRVDLDDSRVDAMSHEGTRTCANSSSTVWALALADRLMAKDAYMTRACASLSGTETGTSINRTASSMVNIAYTGSPTTGLWLWCTIHTPPNKL